MGHRCSIETQILFPKHEVLDVYFLYVLKDVTLLYLELGEQVTGKCVLILLQR